MKKALKACETAKQKEDVREKFSLVTQNYIFFLNAKCEFESQRNRAEAYQLLGDATRQLLKTTGDLLEWARKNISNPTPTATVDILQIAENFLKELSQKDGIVDRLIRLINKKAIQEENEQHFITSLKKLFNKLYKNRNAIGESDLISGLIERYADKISLHVTKADFDRIRSDEQLKPSDTPIYVIAGIGVVSLIARWLIYGFRSMVNGIGGWSASTGSENWALYHSLVFVVIVAGYFCYNRIVFYFRKKARNKVKAAANDKFKRIYGNYMAMAQSFEENYQY